MKKTLSLLFFMLMTMLVVQAQNFFQQSDLQWVAVPDHADWLYHTGQQARIDVQLLYHGTPLTEDVEISYQIGGDCLEPDQNGSVKTMSGHAVITMGTRKQPGFRDCQMQCSIEGQTFKNHIKVGFDPEQLKAYTQMPSDFEAFWKSVLDEQQQVRLKPIVTPAPEFSSASVDCYLVKINGGTKAVPHCIYGYLSIPKDGKKHAVVVSPPGAGVKHMDPSKTQFYATDGKFIRLELEIHGINPALSADDYKDISRAFGDHIGNGYLANGIQSRETYYLKKVYANLVRVIDYVETLPEWDGEHIFLQGNSQGAALSVVLAGLDPRIDAIAIAHPALSDMAGYAEKGRTGGYPHFGRKYQEISLTPEVQKTLSYYDVVNFARLVKCPVYMTWGYNDNTCPPTTSWIVWNTLQCAKEQYLTPINEHWISTETRYRQMRFLQGQMK